MKGRRSLRWRLILAMTIVTFAASAIVGIALDHFTEREFQQFLEVEMEVDSVTLPDLDRLMMLIQDADLAGVAEELSQFAAIRGDRFLLFDSNDQLIADSHPSGDSPTLHDGELELQIRTEGDRATEERVRLRGGFPIGAAEERLATLFVMPLEQSRAGATPELDFRRSVGQARLIGLFVATLLALMIAILLSRQIVRPVESITVAAERLSKGDLGQRVVVEGNDELSTLGTAFNRMAESLERAEASRRNMTGDVAHELRTPLTHLRCKLEAAQDELIPIDRPLIEQLQGEIVHLSRLVDDLQELSLAEAGRLPLHPNDLDLADQLEQVIAALPTGDRYPAVEFIVEGERDAEVHIDADRLKQVTRNLLENAMRYGGQSVELRLEVESVERHAKVLVNDRGPGIEAGHGDLIFDRFHRTDPSRERATGGTGLGLTISRELVLGWGGDIGVQNRAGGGASFWFTVPRTQR